MANIDNFLSPYIPHRHEKKSPIFYIGLFPIFQCKSDIGAKTSLYHYIVLFINSCDEYRTEVQVLYRNIGQKLRPYILRKFKIGKNKRKTINKTI